MKIKSSILVNRQAAGGDVLLTTPIIKKIYSDRYGQCNIDFCVQKNHMDYLKNNPYINNIINTSMMEVDLNKYQLIINLDGVYEKYPSMHIIDAYSIHTFGHTEIDKQLNLFTTAEDVEYIQNKIKKINKFIVIHVRKTWWESRNLPITFWQKFVSAIIAHTDYSIVQIGTNQEPLIMNHERLYDFRNITTIHQLKELINNSKLFVGSDSGPTHIAATTETDIMAFYTSVKFSYRMPFRKKGKFIPFASNIDCYGCQEHTINTIYNQCKRLDNDCINRFDVEEITSSAISLLKEK